MSQLTLPRQDRPETNGEKSSFKHTEEWGGFHNSRGESSLQTDKRAKCWVLTTLVGATKSKEVGILHTGSADGSSSDACGFERWGQARVPKIRKS